MEANWEEEAMIASHIHDALGQVDRLRSLILDRRRFRGYSGTARILGGFVALAAAGVLGRADALQTPVRQLAGWGVVLAAALLLNYGGLAAWYIRRRGAGQSLEELKPALEVLPALAAGAALSVALAWRAQYDLLFGVWMTLYGLAHMGYRNSLPAGIVGVGLFYQAAGIACLLVPGVTIMNPWPMGIVFFIGECAGGWLLRDYPDGNTIEPVERQEEQDHETAN